MYGEPKTGDRLFEIVLEDIAYILAKFGVTVIAWCTDDGPDGKKMRRLLRNKYAWMITTVCWAHQINLVVGDFLSLKVDYRVVIALALDVIKWFNNHNRALFYLRSEQILTYDGDFWALILPVITRWTAHYLSTTRLLKIEDAMRTCCRRYRTKLLECAGRDADARTAAFAVLEAVEADSFWQKVSQ